MCAETYTKFTNRFAPLFHSNKDSKRNAKARLKERKKKGIIQKKCFKNMKKRKTVARSAKIFFFLF